MSRDAYRAALIELAATCIAALQSDITGSTKITPAQNTILAGIRAARSAQEKTLGERRGVSSGRWLLELSALTAHAVTTATQAGDPIVGPAAHALLQQLKAGQHCHEILESN